ncbi:MAG: CbtA family protein [Candidatus Promineifilaceae bacterium]
MPSASRCCSPPSRCSPASRSPRGTACCGASPASLAFQLAPAFGLPPELPGMAAADLGARQVWWCGTALATGVGIFGHRQVPQLDGHRRSARC